MIGAWLVAAAMALSACRGEPARESAPAPAPPATPAATPDVPAAPVAAAPERRPRVDVYGNPNQFDATALAVGDLAPSLTATEWIGPPVDRTSSAWPASLRVLEGQKARARPLLERALRYTAPVDRPDIEKSLAALD